MTAHVNDLKPGDTLEFKGPLGGLALDLSPGASLGRVRRIGLIAGGTGIAPMLQILRMTWVHALDLPIKLIYSAPVPEQLGYLPWLRRKSRMHRTFEMACTVDAVPPGTPWNEVRAPAVGGGGVGGRGGGRRLWSALPTPAYLPTSPPTAPPNAARRLRERGDDQGEHVATERRPAHRHLRSVRHVQGAEDAAGADGIHRR